MLSENYAVKYLQPEDTSNLRVFLKSQFKNRSDCFVRDNEFRECGAKNWEMNFFRPTKTSLVGLTLGGFFDTENVTNVRFLDPINQ